MTTERLQNGENTRCLGPSSQQLLPRPSRESKYTSNVAMRRQPRARPAKSWNDTQNFLLTSNEPFSRFKTSPSPHGYAFQWSTRPSQAIQNASELALMPTWRSPSGNLTKLRCSIHLITRRLRELSRVSGSM